MSDREHNKIADAFRQFARNGRWGTCSGCPRDSHGHAYPEFCVERERGDHALDVDQLAHAFGVHNASGRPLVKPALLEWPKERH